MREREREKVEKIKKPPSILSSLSCGAGLFLAKMGSNTVL